MPTRLQVLDKMSPGAFLLRNGKRNYMLPGWLDRYDKLKHGDVVEYKGRKYVFCLFDTPVDSEWIDIGNDIWENGF